MKPLRQTWIDYARGIAMILVLYRHVFEGIKNAGISIEAYMPVELANIMFFSFRMPLFFIISGFFVMSSLKKKGINNFIVTKARTILYPYFLWGILQITLQLLLSNYVNSNRTLHSYLELFYTPRTIDQFWYLYALFNVTIIYVLVVELFKVKPAHTILIGSILFFISVKAHQADINLGFVADILHYYLFFAIGDAAGNIIRNKENIMYFQSLKLLLLIFVPFIASQYYYLVANLPYASMNYEYVEFYQPFIFILVALTGCVFVILLSFFLQKVNAISWLQILGRHSLYIYVSHVMVLASVRIFMTKILGIYNVPLLLIAGIIMGLVVPVFLYKLAEKFNMRWLFTLEQENNKIYYAKAQ